jgi:hypothetical protein
MFCLHSQSAQRSMKFQGCYGSVPMDVKHVKDLSKGDELSAEVLLNHAVC